MSAPTGFSCDALQSHTLAAPSYLADGWFNNLEYPAAGSAGASVIRYGPTPNINYELPDVLNLTKELFYFHNQGSVPASLSAFFVFFTQFVFMDLVDLSEPTCPREYVTLSSIGAGAVGVASGKNGSYLMRSDRVGSVSASESTCSASWSWRRSLAQQAKNWATGYLDGSAIYGSSGQALRALRSFSGGKVGRCAGNGGMCEVDLYAAYSSFRHSDDALDFPQFPLSPYVDSIRLMWLHWHNHIADVIAKEAAFKGIPALSDESLFTEARRWTIATFQSVVENELTPLLFNTSDVSKNVHVSSLSTYDSFAAAAVSFVLFHFPQAVLQLNDDGKCSPIKAIENTQRICKMFSVKVESLYTLLNLLSSPAKSMDFTAIDDLLYVPSLNQKTYELLAISLGRGRDLSLPPYGDMLNFENFDSKTTITWDYFRNECDGSAVCLNYVERLRKLYFDASHVELLPGGIISFPKVFSKIIASQFNNIRNGDAYWFASSKQFSASQVSCIKKMSLSHIISTVLNNSRIQSHPFLVGENSCWKTVSNYMQIIGKVVPATCPTLTPPVPEVVIPVSLTLAGIALFILGVVVCLYWPYLAKYCKFSKRHGYDFSVSAVDGLYFAKEYMGNHHLQRKWRSVLVEMNVNERTIRLLDPKDRKIVLRKIIFVDRGHRSSISKSARRASQIISHSQSFKEFVSRRRVTLRPQKMSYILTEADNILSLRVPADAHLALKFVSSSAYEFFLDGLLNFTSRVNIDIVRTKSSRRVLFQSCLTKDQHRRQIEGILRSALLEASDSMISLPSSRREEATQFDDILHMCEITLPELASLLRTDPSDKFTAALFNFIDQDHSGSIAYRELVDFMAQIARGNDRDRLNLLFRLYDTDGDGKLSFEDFATMLASLSAVGNQHISDNILLSLYEEIINQKISQRSEDGQDEPLMQFDDLWQLFEQQGRQLNLGAMTLPGIFPTDWSTSKPEKSAEVATVAGSQQESNVSDSKLQPVIENDDEPVEMEKVYRSEKSRAASLVSARSVPQKQSAFLKLVTFARSVVDSYSLELFWGTLYVCICFGLFGLRFSDSYMNQKPVIAVVGLGAPFARGGAIVVSFTFATLILLMARNFFTAIRDSSLRFYFPFDSLVEAHKFISVINLSASALHTFAHVSNFYYFSQLPLSDLWCLMPELKGMRPPPGQNTFVWLAFQTLTGLTGFLLIAVYVPIFAFAFGRSFAFRQFWITHQLWPIAAVLLGLHGLGCLLQSPLFYAFFLGPAAILALDRVVSALRSHDDLRVVSSSILPSGVTRLEFEKPQNMQYVAGQYVRICVPECGHEYHPFTLTSAPHEPNMSLHILAVGPWTKKLNKLVSAPQLDEKKPLSIVRIEGPYGEGHQDWHRSDVAVLIGAGIGVTPFASILKHISHMLSYSYMPYACQKVYFFWITRNQKQFEWFTDIIREVEEKDTNNFTSTQICITQFQSKFDFRTIMLYICERHFQKIHGRSIFTGLKSSTHFGRPNFELTLQNLKEIHPKAHSIGVFTCGPSALIPTVEQAVRANNEHKGPLITHYYEIF